MAHTYHTRQFFVVRCNGLLCQINVTSAIFLAVFAFKLSAKYIRFTSHGKSSVQQDNNSRNLMKNGSKVYLLPIEDISFHVTSYINQGSFEFQ